MPFADDEVIARLEENIRKISSVTNILAEENTPEHLLKVVLEGFEPEITSREDVSFFCNCSKERFARGLILLGKDELENIISEGKDIELKCQFCNSSYRFSTDEVKKLLPRTQVSEAGEEPGTVSGDS
jgi:molecular chaperone Hsp33